MAINLSIFQSGENFRYAIVILTIKGASMLSIARRTARRRPVAYHAACRMGNCTGSGSRDIRSGG